MEYSKNVAWMWVTSDTLLSERPCWLHYAYLVVSAASTDSALHNGISTSGDRIVTLKSAVVTGHKFKPPLPIYCSKGLYVDVGTSVTGIFVQYELEETEKAKG